MDSRKPVTLSREDLYRMVWETPLRTLARGYDISDTGLAEICDSHRIPRPPVGYWRMKDFGKEPPRPPLPACEDPKLHTISLVWIPEEERNKRPTESPPVAYDDDIVALLVKAESMPALEVGSALRGLHRRVLATKRGLDGVKADRYGLVSASWREEPTALDLSVAPGSVRRALRFLNALVRGIEAFGGAIANVQDKMLGVTAVTIAGERVASLRLKEKTTRQPVPVDARRSHYDAKFEWIPSGYLTLECGAASCHDTDKHKIEDDLNGLLIRLIKSAGDLRVHRRQKEELERRRAEEHRIWAEQEQGRRRQKEELESKQKAEQARLDSLMSQAHNWHESRLVRQYIKAVEGWFTDRGGVEEGSEADEWLKWANRQADRLDPLVDSPHSVLDERI